MASRNRILACSLAMAVGFVSAGGVTTGSAQADLGSAAAAKTYKRRGTNFRCKKISEGTQPIFKCPFCGSQTVPQK